MKSLILSIFLSATVLHAKPLKVFILAGQSNMEGHAKISSFDHIGMDPKTAPLLKEMRDKSGNPRVLDNVRMSYLTGGKENGVGTGPLTAGFGSRSNPTEPGEKIGPEFTFGITMEKLLGEPIVIIKTAWGGKSINTDFRPPSAGPYEFNEQQIENFKKQNKDVAAELAKRNESAGVYYRCMTDHVK
ncbi:sialate O-acetylesterase, partial [Akkermansiaceae bacterium]|nr:sialate O-acetylesterase [Akkermansiaceae bacterium]